MVCCLLRSTLGAFRDAKVKIVSEAVGECTKCGSVLKTNKCMKMMMAKVIISGEDEKKNVVTMFNHIVSKVIDGISGDGLSVKLLMANIHKFSIDERDVVFCTEIVTTLTLVIDYVD